MTSSTTEIFEQIREILSPFNQKGVEIETSTTFATDLELDSLSVMDLLAAIEDHFDVTVPLNILPDLENVGQVAEAVKNILDE
ncbi:MAG: acyl carrier protein [Kordiimonadaceae bacterium]|jgi:acyl carrier protein|nr:acyl carrier protein [Kordiimonadaceae bacterium]MBT7581513.1 acyl carrier protein [Kordiimonadaceae bacterium]